MRAPATRFCLVLDVLLPKRNLHFLETPGLVVSMIISSFFIFLSLLVFNIMRGDKPSKRMVCFRLLFSCCVSLFFFRSRFDFFSQSYVEAQV